jgi:hypothetical protein
MNMLTREEFDAEVEALSDTDQFNGSYSRAASVVYAEERAKATSELERVMGFDAEGGGQVSNYSPLWQELDRSMLRRWARRGAIVCSCCDAAPPDVAQLIAGPDHVYVCDRCIRMLADLVGELKTT